MADSSKPGAPLLDTGAHDRKPTVLVTAYILLILVFVSTIVRIAQSYIKLRRLSTPDMTIFVATLLAIAQTACVHLAANNGLGTHQDGSPLKELASYFKAWYASQLFSIAAMALAKVSVVSFIQLLNPHQDKRLRAIEYGAFISWTVFSLFAIAFQCGLPRPWVYTPSSCNDGGVMYPVIILNLLTDLYLALSFVRVVLGLKMTPKRRLEIMAFFGSRLLVVASEIVQLVILPASYTSDDQTWAQAPSVLTSLITMFLSLVCANIIALPQSLRSLGTGRTGAHLTDYEFSQHLWGRSGDALRSNHLWDKTAGTLGRVQSVIDSGRFQTSRASKRKMDETTPSEIRGKDGDGESETGILRTVDVQMQVEGDGNGTENRHEWRRGSESKERGVRRMI